MPKKGNVGTGNDVGKSKKPRSGQKPQEGGDRANSQVEADAEQSDALASSVYCANVVRNYRVDTFNAEFDETIESDDDRDLNEQLITDTDPFSVKSLLNEGFDEDRGAITFYGQPNKSNSKHVEPYPDSSQKIEESVEPDDTRDRSSNDPKEEQYPTDRSTVDKDSTSQFNDLIRWLLTSLVWLWEVLFVRSVRAFSEVIKENLMVFTAAPGPKSSSGFKTNAADSRVGHGVKNTDSGTVEGDRPRLKS